MKRAAAMPRKQPTKKEKEAAVCLTWRALNDDGELTPLLDREWAKKQSAQQIIDRFNRLVEYDHWPIPVAWGGSNHPTNLTPLVKKAHRQKTAKFDAPAIAKVRRAKKKREKERAELMFIAGALSDNEYQRRKAKPKPKRKAIIPGSKASPFRKKMSGKVERR